MDMRDIKLGCDEKVWVIKFNDGLIVSYFHIAVLCWILKNFEFLFFFSLVVAQHVLLKNYGCAQFQAVLPINRRTIVHKRTSPFGKL